MSTLDEKTFAAHAVLIKNLQRELALLQRKYDVVVEEIGLLRDELGAFK